MLTQKGITIPRCLKAEQEIRSGNTSLGLKVTPPPGPPSRLHKKRLHAGLGDRWHRCWRDRHCFPCCVLCHFKMFVACPFSELSDDLLLILLKVIYHKLMARARPCKFGLFSHHPTPEPLFTSKILIEPTSNLLPASSLKVEKKKLLERFHYLKRKECPGSPFAMVMVTTRYHLRLVIMPCPGENQQWFFSSVCCWSFLFCSASVLFICLSRGAATFQLESSPGVCPSVDGHRVVL